MAAKKKKAAAKETKSSSSSSSTPTSMDKAELLAALQARFEKNKHRHKGIDWRDVQARLEAAPKKLYSLQLMELSGGEPDVIGQDKKTGEYLYVDCSAQSPKGRRSCCYDKEARVNRKEHPPETSAEEIADSLGAKMLDEAEYALLQQVGDFDETTSSWIVTPPDVRKLKGALFGDKRYGRVFTYHNGADSYYGARGVRCLLRL